MKNINPVLIDLPIPIETPRLILRPPKVGDGAMLNSAVLESFNLLNKFMLWANEKPSLDDSEEIVRREAANWLFKKKEDPELMLLILDKKTNDFIGATGFHNIDWDVPCVETGYWVRKKYSGQGFITEAINAITRYASTALNVKRISITCDIDNEQSKKIPERLGYQLESIMKSNCIKPSTGEVSDTLVYVRLDLMDLPELDVIW
ncbi:TPA: GNAT family N-acetyltransferase [Legionella pneumophila]